MWKLIVSWEISETGATQSRSYREKFIMIFRFFRQKKLPRQKNLKFDLAYILQVSGHSISEGYGLDPPSEFSDDHSIHYEPLISYLHQIFDDTSAIVALKVLPPTFF
jgi:hypothetical protein